MNQEPSEEDVIAGLNAAFRAPALEEQAAFDEALQAKILRAARQDRW